jgi:hypothetical protein
MTTLRAFFNPISSARTAVADDTTTGLPPEHLDLPPAPKKARFREDELRSEDGEDGPPPPSSLVRAAPAPCPGPGPMPAHLALELETMDPSWLAVLLPELRKPYFAKVKGRLSEELQGGRSVYPALEDVYAWSRACPFEEVKVVLLGQDPYHGVGQAHGLAFSVQPGVPPPPSLLNIYKELERDPALEPPFRTVPGKALRHGHLLSWSTQGRPHEASR